MNFVTKLYVRVREAEKGQTMTEYALILSAVALVVIAGYKTLGTTVSALLSAVDSQL